MKVNIETKCFEFSLELATQEPISDIKFKIQKFIGLPVESQILTICGWELIDGLDLGDYPPISEGTKIHLSTNYPFTQITTKLNITIKFSARKIEIEVDSTDTVRSLKEKIHIVDGTPIKRMTLFYSGVEMEDEFRNLMEYGIGERSEVIVFLKNMTRVMADPPCRRVEVVVQTSSTLMNGAKIPVEISDSSRIGELRGMLVQRKLVPIDEYIFVHKQRIMREDCSLRWHGVDNGDYLYVFKGTVHRERRDHYH